MAFKPYTNVFKPISSTSLSFFMPAHLLVCLSLPRPHKIWFISITIVLYFINSDNLSGYYKNKVILFREEEESVTVGQVITGSYLASERSLLFPAMATTMLGGPCCRSSFTQFFSVWKDSWWERHYHRLIWHNSKIIIIIMCTKNNRQICCRYRKHILYFIFFYLFCDVVNNNGCGWASVVHWRQSTELRETRQSRKIRTW